MFFSCSTDEVALERIGLLIQEHINRSTVSPYLEAATDREGICDNILQSRRPNLISSILARRKREIHFLVMGWTCNATIALGGGITGTILMCHHKFNSSRLIYFPYNGFMSLVPVATIPLLWTLQKKTWQGRHTKDTKINSHHLLYEQRVGTRLVSWYQQPSTSGNSPQ